MVIKWGETERDRVAKAIYEVGVKNARSFIDEIGFDVEEVEELARRLFLESQTAQVLIFFSYLDDRIQQLIKAHLRPNQNKVETDRLFGSNGPLNTFNSRVLLAYHLGWISSHNRTKLDALRKIRNEFAHRAFKVQIDDPALKPHIAVLDYDIASMMKNAGLAQPEMFNSLLCQLVMLALRTFTDLLVLPAAKAMHVHPDDVAGNFDDTPALLKRINLTMSGALIVAAGLPPGMRVEPRSEPAS